MRLAEAFRNLDASGVEELYTDDADWTNAFGTSRRGGTEIGGYLKRLFADPHFRAGKPVGPPQVSMRFVSADVADEVSLPTSSSMQRTRWDPLRCLPRPGPRALPDPEGRRSRGAESVESR